MNILFIGDIFGKPGRTIVNTFLPNLIEENSIDFVVANVENLAHGVGVTASTLDSIKTSGIDCFTGGNHIFKKDGIGLLEANDYPLLRPYNFPNTTPGGGYKIFETLKGKILVANLMGRIFMPYNLECPFKSADQIIEIAKSSDVDFILIDFHAEATSEKIAMKHYLDGRVTALMGTHTHIITHDLQITKSKMAYITDVGMVGIVNNSVLGVQKEIIIEKFLTQMSVNHEIETFGTILFNSILIETDKKKYAVKVELLTKEINE